MRAVFLDFGTVSHDDLDTTQLERALPGITLHATSTDAEVDERIAGVEFILTNKLNISRARMRAVPGLRFIGLTATGTNNVDLEAARELGIAVCNIREYCTVSVTQHVLGSILLLTHRLREYGEAAVDGTWSRSEQFTVPGDGRKFTELYNIQHLQTNRLDPVANVVITTIQRLYSMLSGEPDLDVSAEEVSLYELGGALAQQPPKEVQYNPAIPIEWFDVIVTDEYHRSINNLWRGVL